MRGVNKVILIGNVGQTPEIKSGNNGNTIATFSVATSLSWKDKFSGDTKEKIEWHRVVAYRRLADIVGSIVHKGSKVYIEGSLQTRKWQDNTGQDRFSTEIVAIEMHVLDKKEIPKGEPNGNVKEAVVAGDDFDDDVPF